MNKAKYYIYRNLHRGGFSIRYRGKVIDYADSVMAYNVRFKVNEKGRQRVLREKAKNVHAFVVCDRYSKEDTRLLHIREHKPYEVTYNPYKAPHFYLKRYESEYVLTSSKALLKDNKVYI